MWTTPAAPSSAARRPRRASRRVADRERRSGRFDALAGAGRDVEADDVGAVSDESLAGRPPDEAARAGDGDASAGELH